jgi:hypothetical protein
MSKEKNICKKVQSFHHHFTWFLAPIFVFTPCYVCFCFQTFAISLEQWLLVCVLSSVDGGLLKRTHHSIFFLFVIFFSSIFFFFSK